MFFFIAQLAQYFSMYCGTNDQIISINSSISLSIYLDATKPLVQLQKVGPYRKVSDLFWRLGAGVFRNILECPNASARL